MKPVKGEMRTSQTEFVNNEHFDAYFRNISDVFKLHWHDYFEIELILGGNGVQIMNGREVQLRPGTVTLLRPNDYHEFRPDPAVDFINISFESKLISEDLLELTANYVEDICFHLEQDIFGEVEQLCRLCVLEAHSGTRNLRYVKNLLDNICLKLLPVNGMQMQVEKSNQPNSFQKVITYMHSYFRENPSLEVLAQIANYSPNYFCTVFRQNTGMTYLQYMNRLKVKYAKQLLLTTDLRETDIAFRCGFSSQNTFLRVFKAQVGKTPMEYKRTSQK